MTNVNTQVKHEMGTFMGFLVFHYQRYTSQDLALRVPQDQYESKVHNTTPKASSGSYASSYRSKMCFYIQT
jgi:hypothetical protein